MIEWKSSFTKGFMTCVTLCGLIAGVAIYLNDKIIDLKNETIAKLENKISEQIEFSDKYHQELSLRRQAELRVSDLQEQLSIQLGKKWEEKYLSLKIEKNTLEQRFALLKNKFDALKQELNTDKPIKKYEVEINYLKEELRIAKDELTKVRKLYTKEQQKSPKIIEVPNNLGESDENVYKMVETSIGNLDSTDKRYFLINTYKDTKYKITISQLSKVVMSMSSTDLRYTIVNLSENIIDDGNPDTLKALIEKMNSTDSRIALYHLVKTKNKQQ
jgi:hypothetical protein